MYVGLFANKDLLYRPVGQRVYQLVLFQVVYY